jgi:enoyl-CoA hydratase/carnithine racemase
MTENLALTHHDGGVAELTLARPPVNALNAAYLEEIEERLTALEAEAGVRTVLITSALPVFSAGMDLKEAQDFSIDEQRAVVDGLNGTLWRLYAMRKPVIAAVNRAAIAGGLFLALASDYVIAGEGSKFGLTEVRVGVDFPAGPLEIARGELTPAVCRRLMLGGRNLDADSAASFGIVDEVVDAQALRPRAMAVARDYAAIPPVAYAAVKSQLRGNTLERLSDVIESRSDPARRRWFTDETREAMNALLAAATRKRV